MFGSKLTPIFLSLFAFCALQSGARAAQGPVVIQEVKHDHSRPVAEMAAEAEQNPAASAKLAQEVFLEQQREEREEAAERGSPVAAFPTLSPETVRTATARATAQPAAALPPSMFTAGLNFDGLNVSTGGWTQPDANLAVGATQVVQIVNTRYAVYNKTTGILVSGPFLLNTLWGNFGGGCQTSNSGDPIVIYDQAAGRWVFSEHATPSGGPYLQCLAVSQTGDATGSYFRYSFALSGGNFPDYPKLSVWPDAYYVTLDQQNPTTFVTLNAVACALNRNAMLTGAAATAQCFSTANANQHSILPASWDGATPPPTGATIPIIGEGTTTGLYLWQFHVDFTTPSNSTFTGPTTVPVNSFVRACSGGSCIPQPGTTQLLDSLGDRLMYRAAYRNFGDHESLVVSHALNTSGVVGIRWYEFRDPEHTPTIFQQGIYAPDAKYRWMSSIGMDRLGDIGLGYSVSSSTQIPSIYYTGRLSTDTLGTLQTETLMFTGIGSETSNNRWGDYSGLAIDPTDDCTFWYTNQYLPANGSANWNTRVASFSFPSCIASLNPVSFTPTSLPFPSVNVGSTSVLTATLNNAQSAVLNITNVAITGDYTQTNDCGTIVAANGSCTFTVTFAPTVDGTRTGSITVTDDANGSPQILTLTGTGAVVTLTYSSTLLTLGNQIVGTTSTGKSVTVTNAGTMNATITAIATTGNFAQTNTCSTLIPGATCTITATFTPTAVVNYGGDLTITSNATGSPQVVGLSGVGIATLTVSPTAITFATTNVGSTSAATGVTITNNQSTSTSITFAASGTFNAVAGGTTPCGSSLASKARCTLQVTFSPVANGAVKGGLTITAGTSSPVIKLQGTGQNGASQTLTFSPASIGFGNVVIGATSPNTTVTVTNKGTTTISFTGITASGGFSVVAGGATPCGSTLAVNAKCTELVSFAPANATAYNGAVNFANDTAQNPMTLNLTGTGVLPLALSPSALIFPATTVGTSSLPQNITITNNQATAITLSSVGVSGQYSISSNTCGATLNAAASCVVGIVFQPASIGTIGGQLTVSFPGAIATQEASLSGTGQ